MKAIVTKYKGPTEVRGSTISAKCEGGSVRLSYEPGLDSFGNHAAAAKALCKKMGWIGTYVSGGLPDGQSMVWVESGGCLIHCDEV